MRDDPVKAELLPHIADIISSGDYNYRAKHKERTDDAIHFHEYSKVVPTSIGSLHVVVDVQQRKTSQPPFIVYNLTQEGSWGYKKRFSEKTSEDGITAPASGCFAEDVSSALSGFPGLNVRDNTVFDESTMADLFEIVNIRYERV